MIRTGHCINAIMRLSETPFTATKLDERYSPIFPLSVPPLQTDMMAALEYLEQNSRFALTVDARIALVRAAFGDILAPFSSYPPMAP